MQPPAMQVVPVGQQPKLPVPAGQQVWPDAQQPLLLPVPAGQQMVVPDEQQLVAEPAGQQMSPMLQQGPAEPGAQQTPNLMLLEQQTMPVEVLQHRPLQQSVLVVQEVPPGRHIGVVVVLVVVVLVVVVLVVVLVVVVGGGVVVVVVLVVVVVVVGATHVPFEQIWPTSQHTPSLWPAAMQQSFEQQVEFSSQLWPALWHFAKATPMRLNPRAPPRAAPMALRAWRREVAVARALVSSSNFVGSISVRSFPRERVARPRARSTPGARTVVPERR